MSIIELRNVRKSFGQHEVIHDVSFAVEKGEVVCIIGPSGSGKSTLLRCINGLETYQGGEIVVHGERVDTGSSRIRQLRTRVAMVFQRFNLFKGFFPFTFNSRSHYRFEGIGGFTVCRNDHHEWTSAVLNNGQ